MLIVERECFKREREECLGLDKIKWIIEWINKEWFTSSICGIAGIWFIKYLWMYE